MTTTPALPEVTTTINGPFHVWRCPNCGSAYCNINKPVHLATRCEIPECLTAYIVNPVAERSPRRYDQCDETCTADCGHCKGKGIPHGWAWREYTTTPHFRSPDFGAWLVEEQLDRIFSKFTDDEALPLLQTWNPALDADRVLNVRDRADEVARVECDGECTYQQFMDALDDYVWELGRLAKAAKDAAMAERLAAAEAARS